MQDETVGDKQLWLAAEAIVVGKFGTSAVYKELQRVRNDAAQMIQAYYIDVIEGKDARIANLDRELANKQGGTTQDETVGDGWYKVTFRQEGESEYHKITWGRLGYGNWDRVVDRLACGDTFEPAICMTITEHDALRATIATQAARIKELEHKVEKLESNARIWRAWGIGSYE